MAFIAGDAGMTSRLVNLSDAYWFQEGPGVRNWQFQDSGIKLLNVANITKHGLDLGKTNRHLSVEEVEEKYSHFLVDAGDMVIASSGISIEEDGFLRTRGAFVNHEHLPLCMNTSTIRFKAIDGISSLSYLRHWIDSMNFRGQISRLVTGSAQKNFGPSHLKQITIPLPPLEVQKRIASILDAADALRAKRRESLRKLEVLLKSVFLEMFGDPVTNPKGWDERKLEEIAEIVSGVTKGRKFDGKETIEVPYMRVANVQDGHIVLDDVKTVEVLNHEVKKYALRDGDILLTEGGDPDKLGRGAIWKGSIEPCIHQNHIFRVRVKPDFVLPEFLSALIGSQHGKNYFLRAAKQTTGIASINMTQLKAFPALVPPIELQIKYRDLLNEITGKLDLSRSSSASLETLFSSLQDQAFNGTLDSTAPQLAQLEVQPSLF
jgi:type I restriction enzyme, S subunit